MLERRSGIIKTLSVTLEIRCPGLRDIEAASRIRPGRQHQEHQGQVFFGSI